MIEKFLATGLFEYKLKPTAELAWFAGIAVLAYLAQTLPADWAEASQEPETWIVTVLAGAARVALGVLLGRQDDGAGTGSGGS